ncbi:MAG TPA: hypothetical protein VFH51_16455 [Myxococcota bacterium]|nr:hypothetical protein [Myxococcota bacterium]
MARWVLAVWGVCLWGHVAHAGVKVPVDDASWLSVGALVQPFALVQQEPAGAPSRSFQLSPALRRARLQLGGQLGPHVHLFMETDTPFLGLNNSWQGRLLHHTALVELIASPVLQVDMGLMVLPFSRHVMQGAGALLSLDIAQRATDEVQGPATAAPLHHSPWRDVGVMARGELLGGSLEYRVAVSPGVTKGAGGEAVNPHAMPRFTARVAVNLLDAEAGPGVGGFFYEGVTLEDHDGVLTSPKRFLSVGASASYQPDTHVLGAGRLGDTRALAVDVFVDLPLDAAGSRAVTGQVDYFHLDAGADHPQSGHAVFAEAGMRFDRVEPTASFEWVDPRGAPVGSFLAVRGGLAYWLRGTQCHVKVDFGAQGTGAAGTPAHRALRFVARAQTQVAF